MTETRRKAGRPPRRISRAEARAEKRRARRLQALLIESGLSTEQLSTLLKSEGVNVSMWALQKYAAGTRPIPIDTCTAIAGALWLRPAYLIDVDGPKGLDTQEAIDDGSLSDHTHTQIHRGANPTEAAEEAARRALVLKFEEELRRLGVHPVRRTVSAGLARDMLLSSDRAVRAVRGGTAAPEPARERWARHEELLRALLTSVRASLGRPRPGRPAKGNGPGSRLTRSDLPRGSARAAARGTGKESPVQRSR